MLAGGDAKRTAPIVTTSTFILGINYPWYQYGWDFGPKLTTISGTQLANRWDDKLPQAVPSQTVIGQTLDTTLELQLESFKSNGVTVVRWFIVADGYNLGDPPTLSKGKWAYKPSALDSTYVRDFRAMLQSFKKLDMLLIPVFVDFNLFAPGKVVIPRLFRQDPAEIEVLSMPNAASASSVDEVAQAFVADNVNLAEQRPAQTIDWQKFIKGGRQSVLDSDKSTDTFLIQVLEPLLDACRGFEPQIYAWDIANEPDYGCQHFALDTDRMRYFLFACARRMRSGARKFNVTIGFQSAQSPTGFFSDSSTAGQRWLQDAGIAAGYLPQFHYWPSKGDGNSLPGRLKPPPGRTRSPMILGEFTTLVNSKANNDWDRRGVADHLDSLNKRGFACALMWAANLVDAESGGWAGMQADVNAFAQRLTP